MHTITNMDDPNYFSENTFSKNWYRSDAFQVGRGVLVARMIDDLFYPDTEEIIELWPTTLGVIYKVDEWPSGRRDIFIMFEGHESVWPFYFAPDDFYGQHPTLELLTSYLERAAL